LSLLTYLLAAGSDRIGALDFQASADTYRPRSAGASLAELIAVADLVQAGEDLPAELERAVLQGSSVGGARPKALIDDDGRPLIAKFSSPAANLADIVRHRFAAPQETLRELFARIVFNVLVGNTDDHPRNHAALWDGDGLTLTPAFDIAPQAREIVDGLVTVVHERLRGVADPAVDVVTCRW